MGRGSDEQTATLSAPRRNPQPEQGLTEAERTTLATYEGQASEWGAARGAPDFWGHELARFEQLLPSGRVLDVGSGNGRDAKLLTDHGYQVTGLDISKSLLELAAEHEPRAKFVHGSVYELPFPDRSFDGVWAVASLLHIPKDRIAEALAEIKRVLAPEGLAFIAVKEGAGEQLEGGEFGERFFSYWEEADLIRELEAAGLKTAARHQREAGGANWVCLYAVHS